MPYGVQSLNHIVTGRWKYVYSVNLIIPWLLSLSFLTGTSPRIFNGETNRRQVANLPPNTIKNGRHRIWATSFSNLDGTFPPNFSLRGRVPSVPPLSTPMVPHTRISQYDAHPQLCSSSVSAHKCATELRCSCPIGTDIIGQHPPLG